MPAQQAPGRQTLPEHPVDAQLSHLSSHWLLTCERSFDHSPHDLWTALVSRDSVVRWAPFTPPRDLDQVGPISLPLHGAVAIGTRGKVRTAEKQRMLSLTRGDEVLDFELAPTASATVLRLSHTFLQRDDAASYAAGWHLSLAALEAILGGDEVPPLHGEASLRQGWQQLHDEYAELFDQNPATASARNHRSAS